MMIDLLFSYFLSVGRERLLIEGNEIKFPNQWWKLESHLISPPKVLTESSLSSSCESHHSHRLHHCFLSEREVIQGMRPRHLCPEEHTVSVSSISATLADHHWWLLNDVSALLTAFLKTAERNLAECVEHLLPEVKTYTGWWSHTDLVIPSWAESTIVGVR